VTERNRPHPDAEAVERMERELPAQSPAEEETRAVYQRLIQRIGDLELAEPDPGWEERAVERWRREAKPPAEAEPQPATKAAPKAARRVPWRPLLGALAAAAAALALLILRCGPAVQQGLNAYVIEDGVQHRGSDASIGQTLHAGAAMDAPYAELRIYRDGSLIASCPGGERCYRKDGLVMIDLVMNRAGRYDVRGLSSREPLPPSTRLDVDDLTASERGLKVERKGPITVR
jgi:hypothetical protein